MDLVLNVCDEYFFTPYVYPESIPEDNVYRQGLSLWAISCTGGALLYLFFGAVSWLFFFDKTLRQHKKFHPNQEWLEIKASLTAIPTMSLLTAIAFLFEVRGYSKLYDRIDDYGVNFLAFTFVAFILFTDFGIYWIHRFLHHPNIYFLHKPHHFWKVPSPFASHAFHPLDGFAQSIPYHVYVFLFPMHKFMYLILFVFVNVWSIMIHDNDFLVPKLLRPIINGAAHHTDHHIHTYYNYGQYFTFWDRVGKSFRHPDGFQPGKGVHYEVQQQLKNKSQ